MDQNEYTKNLIRWYLQRVGFSPAIQETKNGYHLFFKGESFNNSIYLSEFGINLTIKTGKQQYAIVAPSQYKRWINEPDFENISELPDLFKKLDIKDKQQLIDAITVNIAYCYYKNYINGNDDIDLAFTAFLVKEKLPDDLILKALKFIFNVEFDEKRSIDLITRTRNKVKNNEEIKALDSLLESAANKNLSYLKYIIELFYKNKSTSTENKTEIKKIEAEVLEKLEEIETIEDLPNFPINVLPEHFKKLVENIADSYNVPVDIPAATLFFFAAGCIGATRLIKINENFKIYPNLYLAIVAESGMRKSPPIKYMMKPLIKKDKVLFDDYKVKLDEYQKELELYKIEKAKFEKEAKKANGYISKDDYPEPPEKPEDKKYLIDDITIEKIAESLSDNPRGLIAYYDELRSLLSGFGKYSKVEAAESEKAFFDKCFDGMYYKYDRKSSKGIALSAPLLSIYGAIQPEIFKYSFKNKDLMSGFFQRWIFYHIPKKLMDNFTGITSNVVANNNYKLLANFIEYLLNLNFDLENRPIEITINNEAFYIFNEYYKKISYQIRTDSLGNGFTGFLSKARNLPAKFALHLLAMGSFLKGVSLTDEIYIPAEIM